MEEAEEQVERRLEITSTDQDQMRPNGNIDMARLGYVGLRLDSGWALKENIMRKARVVMNCDMMFTVEEQE